MSALSKQEGGNHYKDMPIQPIEFITKNKLDWYQGNIIKYASRHHNKGGADDLRKVIHYAELALEAQYSDKAEAAKPDLSDVLGPEAKIKLIEQLRNENHALYTEVGREFLARVEKAKERFLCERGRNATRLFIGRLEQAEVRAAFHAGGHMLPDDADLAQCTLNHLKLVPMASLTEFVLE